MSHKSAHVPHPSRYKRLQEHVTQLALKFEVVNALCSLAAEDCASSAATVVEATPRYTTAPLLHAYRSKLCSPAQPWIGREGRSQRLTRTGSAAPFSLKQARLSAATITHPHITASKRRRDQQASRSATHSEALLETAIIK